MRNPFRYFNSSPEVIRLTVMTYLRYPVLSENHIQTYWWCSPARPDGIRMRFRYTHAK